MLASGVRRLFLAPARLFAFPRLIAPAKPRGHSYRQAYHSRPVIPFVSLVPPRFCLVSLARENDPAIEGGRSLHAAAARLIPAE